jgi:biopolymer transport protein ExbD
MTSPGFVVRFVDVVLILLFGFISIASVRETEIALPESEARRPPAVELSEVVFVGIRGDGTYLVDGERRALRGARALHGYLREAVSRFGDAPVQVRIRASHDTPMRYLVDAGRVCDLLAVPKSFEVKLRVGD